MLLSLLLQMVYFFGTQARNLGNVFYGQAFSFHFAGILAVGFQLTFGKTFLATFCATFLAVLLAVRTWVVGTMLEEAGCGGRR